MQKFFSLFYVDSIFSCSAFNNFKITSVFKCGNSITMDLLPLLSPDHMLPILYKPFHCICPFPLLQSSFNILNFSFLWLFSSSNSSSPSNQHHNAVFQGSSPPIWLQTAGCRSSCLVQSINEIFLIIWHKSPLPSLLIPCSSRQFISHIFTLEAGHCTIDQHVFIDLYPVIILIGMYGCVVLPPQVFPLSGLLPLWAFSSAFYSSPLQVCVGSPCNRILAVGGKAARHHGHLCTRTGW